MSDIRDFIQKTLVNDEAAEQVFRDFVRQKARAILFPTAVPTQEAPVPAQQETPTE